LIVTDPDHPRRRDIRLTTAVSLGLAIDNPAPDKGFGNRSVLLREMVAESDLVVVPGIPLRIEYPSQCIPLPSANPLPRQPYGSLPRTATTLFVNERQQVLELLYLRQDAVLPAYAMSAH
jgi:hypothetical protein